MTLVIDVDRLSETFAALANSTRRAILARLAEGEANANELAGPFELTLPAISKHIKVLERAGLVIAAQRHQRRPGTLEGVVWPARRDRRRGGNGRAPRRQRPGLAGNGRPRRPGADVVHRRVP